MQLTTPTTVAQPNTVTIYGCEYAPKVGMCVKPDGWRFGGLLEAGDAPVDSGYAGSQFRISAQLVAGTSPLNVEITGRTLQRQPGGGLAVRVRITWVQDCEADITDAGWLYVA